MRILTVASEAVPFAKTGGLADVIGALPLALAALEWAASTGQHFDIVHGHDWQAGLVPVLLQTGRAPAAIARTPAVFTIHNLAYQGVFDASWLPRLGLGWELMRIDALEYWGRISYLKSGLMFSRMITTVSP